MSYLTQMAGLAVQNFVSAATGMAVLVAFIRGLVRRNAKTIGNFWVDLTRDHPLHPAAAVAGPGAGARVAGRGADAVRLQNGAARRGHPGRRRQAGHRAGAGPGAGRLAGGDQAPRHQRRRLLQRQLRPPLREPDAAHRPLESSRDADRGRALLHLREDGGGHAAGVGDPGGDDARPGELSALRLLGRGGGQPRDRRAGRGPDGHRPQSGRQHGGQGGALRHRPLGTASPPPPRPPRPEPSTRCTTPTRRWAGSCRSS